MWVVSVVLVLWLVTFSVDGQRISRTTQDKDDAIVSDVGKGEGRKKNPKSKKVRSFRPKDKNKLVVEKEIFTSEMGDFFKAWWETSVNVKDGPFPKKVFNDQKRVIFIAGLDGAGHEQVAEMVKICKSKTGLCNYYPQITELLMNSSSTKDGKDNGLFMVEHFGRSSAEAIRISNLLKQFSEDDTIKGSYFIGMNNPEQSGYLTYPSFDSHKRSVNHPELFALSLLAEMNNVDFRVIYLHQSALHLNYLVHTVPHRFPWEERVIVENANALHADLSLLNPSFYMCFPMVITKAKNGDSNELNKFKKDIINHIHPELSQRDDIVNEMFKAFMQASGPKVPSEYKTGITYYDLHLEARITLLSKFCSI